MICRTSLVAETKLSHRKKVGGFFITQTVVSEVIAPFATLQMEDREDKEDREMLLYGFVKRSGYFLKQDLFSFPS